MKPVEFRSQTFSTSAQWDHGLNFRLQRRETGGVALFSRPAFKDWAIQLNEARRTSSFAVDSCGSIFWINPYNCRLYRFDRINDRSEEMTRLTGCGSGRHPFGRMILAEGRLWIIDRNRSRVIGLRRDTFQIITEIVLSAPIDIAWGSDRLFVLDSAGISSYDVNGNVLTPPKHEHLCRPYALGADPQGQWVYVIDGATKGFSRFEINGSFQDEIGRFSDVAPDFAPRLLAVSSGGNLYASDRSLLAHQFSPDGGYIGDTGDMSPFSEILAMTFSPADDLYVAAPEGIARFSSATGLVGNQGDFYSGTLDSGCADSDCWHRVDLIADLELGGALDVHYASSDSIELVAEVNKVFQQNAPALDKVNAIETLLSGLWNGPDELRSLSAVDAATEEASRSNFRQRSTHSMLFRSPTKRFLWLKLSLSGLAAGARASVSRMRVYYPRLSYLRYLPAVYQEDAASSEFLERFLSIFETVFSDLESTIEVIPEVFDPEHTPKEFLDWLAQWLDLGIEEEWAADVKRELIRKASSLYQKKGRPDGLADFIQIVTGSRPLIQESFEIEQPFVLGEGKTLGSDTRVFSRPVTNLPRDQRTVLGPTSILGKSLLRDTTQVPVDPYRAAAHYFTILLDLSPQEFRRHERGLHRIIRENSPAHVGYEMRLVGGMGLGPNLILGVNFRVQDPQPLHLGYSSLGRSILSRLRYGPEIGIDASISGISCGSNDATFSYGEQ